jgi:glycosyltransferase involved in cell wall biosynthesis
MKKVFFIRSALKDRDIRLQKIINTLSKENTYEIVVICWNREGKSGTLESYNHCKEIRLNLRAPLGVKVLLYIPIWWAFVFFVLLRNDWDLAHATNMDCAVPTVIAGIFKRKPVIYEVLDLYEFNPALPSMVKTLSLKADKLIMKYANAIVLVDEEMIGGLGYIPNNNIVIIYDSPPKEMLSTIDMDLNSDVPHDGEFILFFAGALIKLRKLNIDKVIEAIKDIDGVKLLIAGYGDMVDEIVELSSQIPNKIEFLGKIKYEEVIKNGIKSNLFFVLRDSALPSHKCICGSTLFNAMICSKPILVNKDTSTAIKVSKENCGLVVDARNIEEIKDAIVQLKDDYNLSRQLGLNGNNAYKTKYGWGIMENRLINLYKKLI